jgi:hypothetical protein
MKLRNLEAKYDNLHPDHVIEAQGPYVRIVPASKYEQLWAYARQLELEVQKQRDKSQLYLKELKVVNKAVMRKHRMVAAVQNFFKTLNVRF